MFVWYMSEKDKGERAEISHDFIVILACFKKKQRHFCQTKYSALQS